MKTLAISMVAAGALALSACSTLKTSTDYRPGVDFSGYKTFGFKDVDGVQNGILDARIKSSVSAQLTAKGLTRSDESPSLWVVPHARLSKQTQINSYNTGWGYGWGWGYGAGGATSTTVQEIPVGTLVIDLVDIKMKELVWRGTATDTLNETANAADREKNLDAAMAKLFEGFPPKK